MKVCNGKTFVECKVLCFCYIHKTLGFEWTRHRVRIDKAGHLIVTCMLGRTGVLKSGTAGSVKVPVVPISFMDNKEKWD